MANKYEKRGEIVEFEPGDYCTIRVPKKDRPSGATTMRILVRVLRRRGHVRVSNQSTASSNRNMELKTSTASTNVQLRRMAKSWGIAGARSRSDTLLKRHTLARARGGGYTAVVQAIVAQLAVCATKTASNVLSTVIGALASVPTKR